jgi:hypothetical protein
MGVCSSADDGLMQSLLRLHEDEPVAVTVDDTEATKAERPARPKPRKVKTTATRS